MKSLRGFFYEAPYFMPLTAGWFPLSDAAHYGDAGKRYLKSEIVYVYLQGFLFYR